MQSSQSNQVKRQEHFNCHKTMLIHWYNENNINCNGSALDIKSLAFKFQYIKFQYFCYYTGTYSKLILYNSEYLFIYLRLNNLLQMSRQTRLSGAIRGHTDGTKGHHTNKLNKDIFEISIKVT